MRVRGLLGLALATLALSSCTTYGEGRRALGQGRYTDAAAHFEDVLARDPDRVEAMLGLGIAKYRAGHYDEAVEPLTRAVAREPRSSIGRLYLGLAQLRRGEAGPVEEHFKALVAERPGTRLAAQTERVLHMLRAPEPVSDDLRTFMAASLENESEAEREVAEARRYAHEAELRWRDAYPLYGHGLLLRSRCRC